ncbi:LysR family transcriptional regulator [Paraburkholderia tropica]|uniref:LysR family transcriptional regulator n=1 Tax=Paraburkholderia tropica TaxID=92647 RepID=UPI003015C0C1
MSDSFDLNLLSTLEILLRENNVSRTADRLGLSQAAVSAQLARLRRHFDDELLVPKGRTMEPTVFAKNLAQQLPGLMLDLRALTSARQAFDPKNASRRFTIAAGDIDMIGILSLLHRRLLDIAPSIQLSISKVTPRRNLLEMNVSDVLDEQENDFVIVPTIFQSPDHPHLELYRDRYVCVADASHPLIGDRLDMPQYLSLTHVVHGDRTRLSNEAMFVKKKGIERKCGLLIHSYTAIPYFIVGTPFISTLAFNTALEMTRRFPLKIVELPFDIPPIVLVMQWRRYLEHDLAAVWFRQLAVSVASRMGTGDCASTAYQNG